MKSSLTPAARVLTLLLGAAMAVSVAPRAVADRASEPPRVAESLKLPISPPRDQGDSGLCWVFATLNMLETNYRVRHPESRLEFSPGALQRHAIIDRLRRLIAGQSDRLTDGGLAVEAIALIRNNGLLERSDDDALIDPRPLYAEVATAPEAIVQHAAAFEAALGPAPALTHLDDRPVDPDTLARTVLGERSWTEYDLSADGKERIGPSSDPEARPETRVHFVPMSKLIDLIHASLKRSEAVVWGTTDHALLIFGADYDSDGAPLAYWVKDSLPPYVSRLPAADVHKVLNDVTVTDAPAATAQD